MGDFTCVIPPRMDKLTPNIVARFAARTVSWPSRLWHGTSTKALESLRKARATKGLFLTDDESTALDYAESSARHDKSAPVLVEVNVEALRRAGGTIKYDSDDEDILEQFLYKGPLPSNLVRKIENVKSQKSTG